MTENKTRYDVEQNFLDHLLFIGLFPPKKDGPLSAANPQTITSVLCKSEYERLYQQNKPAILGLLTSGEPALCGAAALITEGDWHVRVEYAQLQREKKY